MLRRLADLPRQGLILVVKGYRLLLKPWLGNACRFEPTCSAYTLEALQRHGALGGTALGAARLAPWLARPTTWRLIDLGVASMMLAMAVQLARPLWAA